MNENRSMAGWIGFASMLLLLVGVIDFFQGLIAVFDSSTSSRRRAFWPST